MDRSKKEIKDWKKGNSVLLSTKDLVFKERLVRKLIERYMGPYAIEEIVSSNAVKLWLPTLIKIYLVVNVSQIVRYKKQVKRQKKEEKKPVEVEGVKEWKVEKILNKKKIRGVKKYLVWWKGFTAKENTWEKKENLKNVKEALKEFKGKISAEVRKEERINIAEKKDFKREKLLEKFTARMLYKWDDGKFKEEYLKKLERNWRR